MHALQCFALRLGTWRAYCDGGLPPAAVALGPALYKITAILADGEDYLRIKSPFHDYYDTAQALGQDQGLVFARVPQAFELDVDPSLPPELQWLMQALEPRLPRAGFTYSKRYKALRVDWEPTLTLFAGKLVACVHVVCDAAWRGFDGNGPPAARWVFDYEHFTEALAELGCALEKRNQKRAQFWVSRYVTVAEFFEGTGSTDLQALALEHRMPLASLSVLRSGDYRSMRVLRVNPRLKDCGFFRYMDAWQAYQELSMFTGNLAAPEQGGPECSDADRALKHGMDEWSFRRPPQGP